MYLKYLQIVNYKNLRNVRLEFGKHANTIIGENDSGKSNAMTAMRILLDSDYYFSSKQLRESDFSNSLEDWRGHWIIISAFFDEISTKDRENEICEEIAVKANENEEFLKSYIRCADKDFGSVTLYIRPNKEIRKQLFQANNDQDKIQKIRQQITLDDYEFVYTARSQIDFTNEKHYTDLVGNFVQAHFPDPDQDDASVLGNKLNIIDVWQHISVVFIDALRDVKNELRKSRNPIKRIFDTLIEQIKVEDIQAIQDEVKNLNQSLSQIDQVSSLGERISSRLRDIVGLVYSPDIRVSSRLKEDFSCLTRYLSVVPTDQDDIDSLGLGHLNILYIALKLVEFEVNRKYEVLNIMILEEPEAHIHTHIQRTIFDNLAIETEYTQVIMTTHSTHISEVSHIKNVNVLKITSNGSIAMRPDNQLDEFGKEHLQLKLLSLTDCLERYLDAKRSVLLFSKGVILVEGDAEEILIPALVKKTLGISLDELGIGLVNIGSVAFEYIASLFSEDRLKRYCAIITDLDRVVEGAKKSKVEAEKRGKIRQEKLERFFQDNTWVDIFYAPHTFEVDLFTEIENRKYIVEIAGQHYVGEIKCQIFANQINQGTEAERYDAVMRLAEALRKGWIATLLSQKMQSDVRIPDYILQALAFASQEVISPKIKEKLNNYARSKGVNSTNLERYNNYLQEHTEAS